MGMHVKFWDNLLGDLVKLTIDKEVCPKTLKQISYVQTKINELKKGMNE